MVESYNCFCADEKKLVSKCAPIIARFVKIRVRENRWNSSYEYNMRAFDRMLALNYPNDEQISQEMIEHFAQRRGDETNTTQRARIHCVIELAKFIIKTENREDLNVTGLKFKNPRKRRFHYMEEEQISRFFQYCDNVGQFLSFHASHLKSRRMTILIIPIFFRLLYSSGIRVNEARYLLLSDVDLTEGVIRVKQAKGGNEYLIVLHDTMLTELRKYDAAMDKVVPNRDYFFPSYQGGCLSKMWQASWFRKIWDKANGKNSQVIAYDFRHNYAITNINSWPQDGREFFDRLTALSKSMGHAKIDSCIYYYELTPRFGELLEKLSDEAIRAMIMQMESE